MKINQKLTIQFTHNEVDRPNSNDKFSEVHAWNFPSDCKNIGLTGWRDGIAED